MALMTLTEQGNGKKEKDLRLFALCQRCGARIHECVDYIETKNQGVVFSLKCPHCGECFNHQIMVVAPSCPPPNKEQMSSIIDMVMDKMGLPKKNSDDTSKYRIK